MKKIQDYSTQRLHNIKLHLSWFHYCIFVHSLFSVCTGIKILIARYNINLKFKKLSVVCTVRTTGLFILQSKMFLLQIWSHSNFILKKNKKLSGNIWATFFFK